MCLTSYHSNTSDTHKKTVTVIIIELKQTQTCSFKISPFYADAFNSEEEPTKTLILLFIIVLTRSLHLLTEALCVRYLYPEGPRCQLPPGLSPSRRLVRPILRL